MNLAIIMGHLGRSPELRFTANGQAVCQFSMATTERWKDQAGQQQEKTEWHTVVAFGKLAETCNQYLKKGSQAVVQGRIQYKQVEGAGGAKRYFTEIVAKAVRFVGSRQAGEAEPAVGEPRDSVEPEDELPY